MPNAHHPSLLPAFLRRGLQHACAEAIRNALSSAATVENDTGPIRVAVDGWVVAVVFHLEQQNTWVVIECGGAGDKPPIRSCGDYPCIPAVVEAVRAILVTE